MGQPFIISAILGYFKDEIDLITALLYALLLTIGICINTLTHHPLFLTNNLIGMKMRLACSGLIYKKVSIQFEFVFSFKLKNFLFKIN